MDYRKDDDRKLRQLLREADRDAAPPPDGHFGARVRQLDRRRRRRQKVSIAALGLLVVGGLTFGLLGWRSVPTVPTIARDDRPGVDVAQVQAELAELQARIARQETELAALLAAEKRASLDRRLLAARRRISVGNDFEREVERTAIILLVGADWKIERYEMIESARSDYQQVLKSFPQTEWAKMARQRLRALPLLPMVCTIRRFRRLLKL